jgi:AraC-like DNA-binding protein
MFRKLEIDMLDDKSERIRYNLPDVPIFISKMFMEAEYDTSIECHWHSDIEFVLVTYGELQYNINGEVITLRQGQGVFVNSKQLHYGYTTGGNVCECITVIFHPSLLCPSEHFEFKFVYPVINNNNFVFSLLSEGSPWSKVVFDRLVTAFDVFDSGDTDCVLKLQSIFYDVWGLIYGNMPPAAESMPLNYEYNMSSLKEMIDFIHTHYTERLTLANISAAGKVCRSKCCGLFKEFLHQTPLDYLTTHRLRKAVNLLSDKTIPLSEVCGSVGFNGMSYFAKVFRVHYKCSPSEYRALCG